MSFQISITPNRRAAGRFVAHVRRSIQKALIEEKKSSGISQSKIARALGVHRSVINREIRGYKDITLGRVAELAWALGRDISFELVKQVDMPSTNIPPARPGALIEQRQSTTEGVTTLPMAEDRMFISKHI